MLLTICAGLLVFAVVVIFHELAHFFVARAFGVCTECFSIGFGPTLWSRRAADGTLYRVALIPLGGYVKMKGEQHPSNLKTADLSADAFHNKPIWQRMLVVLAGPFSNFVLAVILFWLLLFGGQTTIKPVIGQVLPNSIAAKAGLAPGQEIIAVAGDKTNSWQQVMLHLAAKIGARGQLQIATSAHGRPDVSVKKSQLQLAAWNNDSLSPDPLLSLGIIPYHPQVPLRVDKIEPQSPASKAGINLGDHLIKFSGQRIHSWQQLQSLVLANPGKKVNFTLLRDKKYEVIPVVLGAKQISGKNVGDLGVASFMKPWPASMLRHYTYTPWQQLSTAFSQVGFYTLMNVKILGRLISGHVSVKSLGGPIMIFQTAGQAATLSWRAYVHLLAVISILVGFFNLLPIPLVDGGVFMFQVVEWARAKPAPIWVQNMATHLGIVLILYLFVQASYNDILRLF